MTFKIKKEGIDIIPENEQDQAYIEDTLNLKDEGDYVKLVRKNAIGLHVIADLTTHPFPVPEKLNDKSK